MIKFSRVISIWFCIILLCVLPCSAESEGMDIKNYPKYFSTETWEAIRFANDQRNIGAKQITAIMDSPVEYGFGLLNDLALQKEIMSNDKDYISNPYHGTAVANLLASKPRELECYYADGFTTKTCDKSKMVVAGVAWHTKIANINACNKTEDVSKWVRSFMQDIDGSIQNRKNIKSDTSRTHIPERVIVNFSIGPDDILKSKREEYKQDMSTRTINSDAYFLMKWAVEFIDNKMQWVIPQDSKEKNRWDDANLAKLRFNIQKKLEKEMAEKNKEFANTIEEQVSSRKDYVLAVVAAGNYGQKLEYSNEIKNGPVVWVAAGCDKSQKKLCPWSNYGNKVVHILAPGENIPVVLPVTGNGTLAYKSTYSQGTSFSAPLVAGTAALLAQCAPTASTDEIKQAILGEAYKHNTLSKTVADGAVLNVKNAINRMCKTDIDENSEKPKEQSMKNGGST